MNADRAAELLQIPERGLDLLQRFEAEPQVQKAIQAVQSGFAPVDVAKMYELTYDEELEEEKIVSEGDIHVYECQTKRCKQKNRVATCSLGPDEDGVLDLTNCPGCGYHMVYVMSVEDEGDIEFRRTGASKVRFHDAMHGVDKSGQGGGEDD